MKETFSLWTKNVIHSEIIGLTTEPRKQDVFLEVALRHTWIYRWWTNINWYWHRYRRRQYANSYNGRNIKNQYSFKRNEEETEDPDALLRQMRRLHKFLQEVKIYPLANGKLYPTNMDKLLFMLSYMSNGGLSRDPPDLSGSARIWSDPSGFRSEFFWIWMAVIGPNFQIKSDRIR